MRPGPLKRALHARSDPAGRCPRRSVSLRAWASLALALPLLATIVAPDAARAQDIEEALAAHRAGDRATAHGIAVELIERGTNKEQAYLLLARVAREAGQLDALEAYLVDRLRYGADLSTAEWMLGRVHAWQDGFESAIPHLVRAIRFNPGELTPYLELADCHLAQGNRSLTWLDDLRGLVGHNWAELTTRAYVLMETGNPVEAEGLLSEALGFQPRAPQIHQLMARIHLRTGDSTKALAALERALAALVDPRQAGVDPSSVVMAVELDRARVYAHAGRYEDALDTLADVEVKSRESGDLPLLAEVLSFTGIILTYQSRLEEASDVLQEAAQIARQSRDRRAGDSVIMALADLEMAKFQTRSAMDRLGSILTTAAETGDERDLPAAMLRLGLASLDRGEYLEALPYFGEASERAERSGKTITQQAALVGAAEARLMLAEHRRGLELSELALALADRLDYPRGLTDAHLIAGAASYRLGLFEDAETHFIRALEIAGGRGFERQRGRTYLNLGLVADALGQAEMAQDWFRQALDLAARIGDRALEVDCETQIAEGHLEIGGYEEALAGFGRALESATESGYLEGRGVNLTANGEVYKFLGDYRRAISFFEVALQLSQQTHNRVAQATNMKHLGEVFALLEDYSTSLNHLERSLRTNRATGNALGEGETLLAICQTLNAAGRYVEARDKSLEALSLAERRGNQSWRARASIELGNAHLGLAEFDLARSYFERGRNLALDLGRPALEWPADIGLARVLSGQGETEPAIEMARQAVDTLERLRSTLNLPERRAGFLEDRLEPYEQLVILLIRKGNLAEAFQVMEYSRSRAFLEILSQDADSDAEVAKLREQEIWLGREIERTTERLASAADPDSATTSVLKTLRELRSRQDAIRQLIGPDEPTAKILTGARPLDLTEIQSILGAADALVEYYVTHDDLITFIITRDQVSAMTRTESEQHLAARVKLLRDSVADPGDPRHAVADWTSPSYGLYSVLIAPIASQPQLEGKTDLIIIPHKFLHYVPFQALIDSDDAAARFLVEDYNLSYAPSASVLGHCLAGDAGTRRSALALANPTPRDLQGSLLPYVRNEVLAVQRVFGENARVAVGSGATETLAKTEGPANDVIHIATHYEIDQHDPLRSSLDLAATDVDDGDLMVREVMELSIQANLVVLSGCSTANSIPGIAELPNSDDWVSLTRAFIYAGAPSVVATLWPINDRSTATFMSRFYELLPTHPKSQALSMAQRDLLAGIADPHYRDPYYWAPFVLVGSGR